MNDVQIPLQRKLIRVDGSEIEITHPITFQWIKEQIGAHMLDFVMLKDGVHVMIVDDTGNVDGKEPNPKATALYYEKCGGPTDWKICGDVVVIPDGEVWN